MATHPPVNHRLTATLAKCKQRELTAGVVYFVLCNEFVKIGFAFNAADRVCQLQVGNPYKLELIEVFPSLAPEALEEEIHSKLEQYLVRGEWFKLPDAVLKEIILEIRAKA